MSRRTIFVDEHGRPLSRDHVERMLAAERRSAPRGGGGRVMAGATVTPELRRRLEAAEATERKVNRREGEPLVDVAIGEGKIGREQREAFLRLFESDPDTTRAVLEGLQPHPDVATHNRWTPETERAYQETFRGRFGVEPI